MKNPFRYFDSSSEVIRVVAAMYVKYPVLLRKVGDLLPERGISATKLSGLVEPLRPDVRCRDPA
jgi:hypothetical protein